MKSLILYNYLGAFIVFLIFFCPVLLTGQLFSKTGEISVPWLIVSSIVGLLLFVSASVGVSIAVKKTNNIPESLRNSEYLSHEDEMAYKAIVSQILNELQPNAKVRINNSIIGFNSKNSQKVDISIRKEIEGQELLTVIKTHAGKEIIDAPDLYSFSNILNDTRASKGIIISNAGFSENARHLAPSYGIDLYSIIDAKSTKWKDDIKIPVLYIKFKLNFQFQGAIYLEKGDTISKDPVSWIVSFDGGKTQVPLVDDFIMKWNKNKIPQELNKNHSIKFNEGNFSVLVSEKKWVKIENPLLTYNVGQEGYLQYFSPEEYRAIKNHLSGEILTSALYLKFKFLKDHADAIKINDIEQFKNRTKGVLITLTTYNPQFGHVTEKEMSIGLIKEP